MRLAAYLLIVLLLQVSVDAFSQKVTIAEKNISLDKIFTAIQQQTGYSLLYDNKLIKNTRNIDINISNASIQEVLEYCFKDLPLTFFITDKIIVIKQRDQEVQQETICVLQGQVLNESNQFLEGASVYIKELKLGSQTDANGNFSFKRIKTGNYTLEVSFIGFATVQKKISIPEDSSRLEFHLTQSDLNLIEISVTALGINRRTTSLTYSTQTVPNEEFTRVKNTNLLNSINGKVSGIQINRTSAGAGGSVRIVLRGDKSTRNSQPLYVVDGLPIVNPIGGPTSGLYNVYPDGGDILSTMNPDDIESINILKGASASTLYGSQGSNGVILITTKKGKTGINKIDFSNSTTFESPLVLPELQFDYQQTTLPDPTSPGTEDSWGPKVSGLSNGNYVKKFFETGLTLINSVSLSSGNERSSNYLSYSNTNNKGILPSSSFKQNTLSFRQISKLLSDKLTFDATFFGSIQNAHNRLTPGIYFNPLSGLYMFPRGLNFAEYKNFEYFSPSRYLNTQHWWNINYDRDLANGGGWGGQDYQQNPYWILKRNPVDNRNQNVYVSISLKYPLNRWIYLQARGNVNNFLNEYERHIYASTQATLARFNGDLRVSKSTNTTIYGDMLLTGEKAFSPSLSMNFTLGASIQDQKGKFTSTMGTPSVANVFLESALLRSSIDIRNDAVSKQMQSVFGSVQLNYKNKLFLDLADRNDWSSTLAFTPSETRGFNYYSIGTSALLTNLLKFPAIVNFAKIRASYAIAGNDIGPYSTYALYYFWNGGITNPPLSTPVNVPGYYLRPEKNKSLEIGTQWKLFQNKLSLDFTWYKTNIVNQYFQGVTVPPGLGSGGLADINGGNIQNKGIELSLNYKFAFSQKVGWNTTINFSRNKNTIIRLFNPALVTTPTDGQFYRLTGGPGGYQGILKQGGSYGDIYGRAFKKNADGAVIVNAATGLPYFEDEVFLGNPNPKFIMGWNNSFTVRNLAVSFLIDGKFGGKVLSLTEGYLDQMGVSERTGAIRDRDGKVSLDNAVDENGVPWKGMVDAKAYYKHIGGKTATGDAYIYDATAIRLREVCIALKLPKKTKVINDVTLALIGNNLLFFYRKAPFDPEQVAGVNPGGVGVDTFGLPAYRSVGFTVKFSL